jgi:hypothetical protein
MKRSAIGVAVFSLLAAALGVAVAMSTDHSSSSTLTLVSADDVGSMTSTGSPHRAAKPRSMAKKALDLRYRNNGHYVNFDYTFDGSVAVYKHGGLGAAADSPTLARIKVSTVRSRTTGTARITITSKRAVTISPSNFTWVTRAGATTPMTTDDVTVPAGTHTRILNFEDVVKGRLHWNLQPETDWAWTTR